MTNDAVPFGATPAERAFLAKAANDIRGLLRSTAANIIAVGQTLMKVKERLPHGQFGKWLLAEFEWSDETARRFMLAAEHFGGKPQIVEFDPSALYLLAARSAPESARTEALGRAGAGERITPKVAAEIIEDHKPEKISVAAAPAARAAPPAETQQPSATKNSKLTPRPHPVQDLYGELLKERSALRAENNELRQENLKLRQEASVRELEDLLRRLEAPTVRRWWHDLAKIHDPDRGGNAEVFKALCDAKDRLVALIKDQ